MSNFLVADGDTSYDNLDDNFNQSNDNSRTSESPVRKVINRTQNSL
jgi:hypothetical protein